MGNWGYNPTHRDYNSMYCVSSKGLTLYLKKLDLDVPLEVRTNG